MNERDNFKNNVQIPLTFYSQVQKISRVVTHPV